jgi:hypothetical protein
MKTVKFNIRDEAQKLLGMMVFDELDSKQFVNWAVNSISNGYETESLLILAGLDVSDTEERKEYFRSSLKELNIELKEDKFEILEDLAKHVSKSVLDNQLSSISGLIKMLFICGESKYENSFADFYNINEDINLMSDGFSTHYIKDLNESNKDEKIKREFAKYLEQNHKPEFRNWINNKSIEQLIEMQQFDTNIYSKDTLIIVEQIIREINITKEEKEEIIKRITEERSDNFPIKQNVDSNWKGAFTWLTQIIKR